MKKTPRNEAIKEFGRTLIFGLISVFITVLGMMVVGINQATGDININWLIVRAIFFAETLVTLKLALTSAVDKYLHEAEGKDINGLSPF